jgi:acetyltransferase-like isoleucine patch superfamily enzyme
MTADRRLEWDWYPGIVPENVALDETAYLETTYSFQLFRSRAPNAVRIGRGSSVYLGVMFDLGPDARVELGDYVLLNGARIICDSEITIGDHSLISWNVVLMDNYRLPVNPGQRRAALQRIPDCWPRHLASDVLALPIRIGANVWIGFDSCVLPGVTIGDGAVVGARSVVAREVPPYTVVAGNPARVVRTIHPEEKESDVPFATQ